ncbi:hypothetical protein SAMN06265367_104156 [Algoriphagus winogradskyi]|uniref:Four-helix bundle copper-binding protein n=1 Tax=Algoriphagus winogradskyi TaxID=237017 RepID=A0ABY1P3G6_9BACT|nr:hypothetical protein SAMN06265367_104156 [Algoriphagus winogradskyi]
MTRFIQLKSNCTLALERCIRNCHQLVSEHRNSPGMEKCIEKAKECIDICVECLDACESAKLDRGRVMNQTYQTCEICLNEFKQHELVEFQECANACLICMEELEYILA